MMYVYTLWMVLCNVDVMVYVGVYKEMVRVNARLVKVTGCLICKCVCVSVFFLLVLCSASSCTIRLYMCIYHNMCVRYAVSSVDSLSVTDSTSDDKLRKIVSLAEDTDKASSLEVYTSRTVFSSL